jgi:hypothetical protein
VMLVQQIGMVAAASGSPPTRAADPHVWALYARSSSSRRRSASASGRSAR